MIFTDRTITVRKGESRIDEPIVVYRGDYELEVRFTILNSRFKFMSGTNMIESEKASYGQLAILTPYGGNIFSDIVRCNDGSVTFVLTAEMLNQIEEVGLYSFQIRLMDYIKESRVSIPPIEFGIEVREPIASEDHDNSVNNAIVGYSIAKVVDPKEEKVGDTFDENGNYNKTKWETGDRISEGKLNKIEDAIDKVNKNEMNNSASLSKRIDNNFNVLDSTKADMVDLITERSRINSLTKLTDGSTSGDAELIDGRIGANGVTYTNLGTAIRNQIKDVSKETRYISLPFKFSDAGYYIRYDTGGVVPHERDKYFASDFVEILPQTRYIHINNIYFKIVNYAGIAFYDKDKVYISGYQYHDGINGRLTVTAPSACVYIRFTYYLYDDIKDLGSPSVYQDGVEMMRYINDKTDSIMSERITVKIGKRYSFIKYDGSVTEHNSWFTSEPITLNIGETLYVYARGHMSNVAVIAEYNTNKPLVISVDSENRWYKYTAERDGIEVVYCASEKDEQLSVYKQPGCSYSTVDRKIKHITHNDVKYTVGYYIRYTDGEMVKYDYIPELSSSYLASEEIRVTPGSKIAFFNFMHETTNLDGMAFYDKNHKFVSGIQYEETSTFFDFYIDIPDNARYVRFTMIKEFIDLINVSLVTLDDLHKEIDLIREDITDGTINNINYCQIFHKIAGIGDSLMSGEVVIYDQDTGANKNTDCYNYSWLSNLCKKIGSEAVHYSRGGRTTQTWLDEYLSTMLSESPKPSAYFIALGTNDSRLLELGSESDCGTNANTFYGLYSRIIREVKNFNPDAPIFCFSLYFDVRDTSIPFSEAIRRMADMYDCYFIDFLNEYYEYSVTGGDVRDKFVYSNHFTCAGYVRVSEQILNLVNKAIYDNEDRFRKIAINYKNLE